MALSVNSNIQALNAYRNVNKTQSTLSSSLEKLSSGLRINRAADDAAGLAISEGLKAQIGGIQQASKNAQDGVSLVQTADGALAQTQTILQRLRTLAVASANGSQSDTSRSAINSEATSLKAELTRIAQTSNFNGVNLLDGTLKTAADFQIGYRADDAAKGVAGNKISVGLDSTGTLQTIAAASAAAAKLANGSSASGAATDYIFSSSATAAVKASLAGGSITASAAASFNFATSNLVLSVTLDGVSHLVTVATAATSNADFVDKLNLAASTSLGGPNKVVFSLGASGINVSAGTASASVGTASQIALGLVTYNGGAFNAAFGFTASGASDLGENATLGAFKVNLTVDGVTKDLELTGDTSDIATLAASLTAAASTAFGGSGKVTFAVSGTSLTVTGATTGDTGRVKVNTLSVGGANATSSYGFTAGAAVKGTNEVEAYTSKAGSFDAYGLDVDDVDLSEQSTAATAIGKIDAAITQISTQRASLGALQNRFQYTVDNLDTSAENLASAQSRILDTDMASEMVSFTRSQILSQAGSAMLAQAKNLPSSLLSLLQS